MSITTILQTYKRPNYIIEQINAIKQQTLSSNIIIVENEGGCKFDYPEDITHVIRSSKNMKFHLRFAIGLLADTEYIAFFDDDSIPGCNWYKNCVDTIARHDCICGTNGRIIDRKNKKQFGPGWSDPSDYEVEVDFVGHAWFFKKKNLKYMWYDDIMEYQNGEDIQLSANAQIFGKILTFVPPHPISDKTMWGSGENAMKYGTDKNASYILNPTHNDERYKLFDYYVNKDWQLILEK